MGSFRRLAVLLPLAAISAACDASPQDRQAPSVAGHPGAPASRTAPPSPREVLRNVYMGQGPMPWRYDATRGTYHDDEFESEMGFWHSVGFTYDRHRYFTGFTYKTPDGPFNDPDEAPSPISIDQATFLNDGGRWRIVDTGFVGEVEVDRAGRRPKVDSRRSPHRHGLPNGALLLLVPVEDLAGDADEFGYLALHWQPRGMAPSGQRKAQHPNGAWSTEGVLRTGRLAANAGSIRFERSGDDAGLPVIRIMSPRPRTAGGGPVDDAGAGNGQTFRYDAALREYVRNER